MMAMRAVQWACMSRNLQLVLSTSTRVACQKQFSQVYHVHSDRKPVITVCLRHHFLEARDKDHHEKEKRLTLRQEQEYFDKSARKKAKDKETFHNAVTKYLKHQGVQRRGHVEFIYASMNKMVEFGIHKDLETYKVIMSLFPKGKMVSTSTWQRELMHYPKQQQCMIDLLDQMEHHGVIPDDPVGQEIIDIFGYNTYPMRKYQRMMYWMPKFKYANPYYVPYILPDDPLALAKLALKRMAVDLENKVTVFEASEAENSIDNTFIVSAQSPQQQDLIANHSVEKPIYIEGGFKTWLREKSLTYFIMRADQTHKYKTFMSEEEQEKDTDDEDMFKFTLFEEENPKELVVPPSVHEQEDGTILAMCMTGTGSKDSLASWVKCLQRANPKLAQIPVLFVLSTPEAGIQVYEGKQEEQQVAFSSADSR